MRKFGPENSFISESIEVFPVLFSPTRKFTSVIGIHVSLNPRKLSTKREYFISPQG